MGIKKIFSLVVMSLCLSSVQAQDEKKVGKVQENQRGAEYYSSLADQYEAKAASYAAQAESDLKEAAS